MKRPTWVTTTGIISIVFAAFGILGGGQLILTPKILEMQKTIFSNMQATMEQASQQASQQASPSPDAMFSMMETMWETPSWFGSYCVIAGIIGVLLAGFFLFSAIHLLQTRPSSIKVYYSAASLMILFSIIKVIAALLTNSFMGFGMIIGSISGIVFYTVLFIVAAVSDKSAFSPLATQPLPQPPPIPQELGDS